MRLWFPQWVRPRSARGTQGLAGRDERYRTFLFFFLNAGSRSSESDISLVPQSLFAVLGAEPLAWPVPPRLVEACLHGFRSGRILFNGFVLRDSSTTHWISPPELGVTKGAGLVHPVSKPCASSVASMVSNVGSRHRHVPHVARRF